MSPIMITFTMLTIPKTAVKELLPYSCICKCPALLSYSLDFLLVFMFVCEDSAVKTIIGSSWRHLKFNKSLPMIILMIDLYMVITGQMSRKGEKQFFQLPKWTRPKSPIGINYLSVLRKDFLYGHTWEMPYSFGAWNQMPHLILLAFMVRLCSRLWNQILVNSRLLILSIAGVCKESKWPTIMFSVFWLANHLLFDSGIVFYSFGPWMHYRSLLDYLRAVCV